MMQPQGAQKSTETTERRGVVCPKCGCAHLPVQYTRRRSGFIMRVRQCRHCGRRIVTRER